MTRAKEKRARRRARRARKIWEARAKAAGVKFGRVTIRAAAGPKFKRGTRVWDKRHGRGTILDWFHDDVFGYCYSLRLDSGFSSGGAVPEARVRRSRKEAPK